MAARIGPFDLTGELGRGGMGAVYRARDSRTGVEVALKVIHPEEAADPRFRERFAREAQALIPLKHPGIVGVHETGLAGATAYLAMDLLPGGSLRGRIKEEGRLPPREVARLGIKLADALAYAHERGLVHRDLKPDNVLLTKSGDPVVADFGLVRLLGEAGRLTRTGEVLGSPSYMAPEQADGDPRLIGPAVDVYGLGATLYAALAGHPPFVGSARDVLVALLRHDAPPLSTHGVQIDLELEAIVLRCLAKAPADRFPDMPSLSRALSGWLSGRRPRSRPRRRRGPLIAGASTTVVAVVAVVAFTMTSPSGSPAAATPPTTATTVVEAKRPVVAPPKVAPSQWPPEEPRAELEPELRRRRAVAESEAEEDLRSEILRLSKPPPVTAPSVAPRPGEKRAAWTQRVRDDAGAAFGRGETELGEAILGAALLIEPDDFVLRFDRANQRQHVGEAAAALEDMNVLAEKHPERRRNVFYKRGACLLSLGRLAEARVDLERMPRDNFSTLEALAQVYLLQGELDLARACYEQLVRDHPRRFTGPLGLAQMASRHGRDVEALELLDRAAAVTVGESPADLWHIVFERGRVLARLGRADAAREAFAQARAGAPAFQPVNAAEAQALAGDRAGALAACEALAPTRARDAQFHALLARLHDDAGRAELALEHARRALALDPAQPGARAFVALLRIEAKDVLGGLATCDRPGFDQHHPQVLASRALALLSLGQRTLARADVTVALDRDPRCPEALALEGLLLLDAGEQAAGAERLAAALGATIEGSGLRRRVQGWSR